jgi:hypothetical protein
MKCARRFDVVCWCVAVFGLLWIGDGLFGNLTVQAAEPEVSPAAAAPARPTVQRPTGPFQLVDGDRVAFVGDTVIERMAREELVETVLTLLNPSKNILFRNLGWSADTVFGDSRAGFGTAADGFKQLTQQVRDFQPTVVIVAYANAMSAEREAGLSRLDAGYAALLDMLAEGKPTIILLSATPHEALPSPYPDPTESNQWRKTYSDRIAQIAATRGLLSIDLFTPLSTAMTAARGTSKVAPKERRLTDNGVHFNPQGYWEFSRALATGLGLKTDTLPSAIGVKGEFVTTVGDKQAAVRAEALRQRILEKNLLFFHRWRPQNETYLFGFRKHEQGQNAKEIPMFDPLIEKVEAEIAAIRTAK